MANVMPGDWMFTKSQFPFLGSNVAPALLSDGPVQLTWESTDNQKGPGAAMVTGRLELTDIFRIMRRATERPR